MNIGIADIVISINGRDAGKKFIVIAAEDEYSLIADGKGRRLEKPKRKKNKHLTFAGKSTGFVASKLKSNEKITNNEIRRALAEHAALTEQGSLNGNGSRSGADMTDEGGM